MKLNWYDGGLYPPRPDALPDDVTLKSEGGVIFIGEKGILMNDTYGANPRLFPESLTEEAALVPKTYAAHPVESRDELGEGDQGRDEGELAARVRRAADGDDVARGSSRCARGRGGRSCTMASRWQVTNSRKPINT